jgi:hypothetical protein
VSLQAQCSAELAYTNKDKVMFLELKKLDPQILMQWYLMVEPLGGD